jgi:oxygen-independent coproporphyrinogen-3 oxidase
LGASEHGPLSLYVHVPFCAAKCRYCDFYSEPADRSGTGEQRQAAVVAETIAQLDRFLAHAPDARFQTVYVGGGTPSVLRPGVLKRLLDRLSVLHAVEWTVEANPESLDREFLDACRRAGVTRLSLGVQSRDDRLLAVLGRPGTDADNSRALEMVRDHWSAPVSLDLISGIPGQTGKDLRRDIETVARVGFAHASLYSLTVEPGTRLAELIASGAVAANRRDHDDRLWLEGRAMLQASGLRQYEVSNFARPGQECRHNLRYWRLEPYLGIGPGAVSTLPPDLAEALTGTRVQAPAVRLANPRDIGRFLSGSDVASGAPWGIETEAVAAGSFVLETLMMGLRLVSGISAERFRRRFGREADQLAPGVWSGWVARGLAAAEPGTLRLTDRGLLVLDTLLGVLAEKLSAAGLTAGEVNWPDPQPQY